MICEDPTYSPVIVTNDSHHGCVGDECHYRDEHPDHDGTTAIRNSVCARNMAVAHSHGIHAANSYNSSRCIPAASFVIEVCLRLTA